MKENTTSRVKELEHSIDAVQVNLFRIHGLACAALTHTIDGDSRTNRYTDTGQELIKVILEEAEKALDITAEQI
jgi:hypothetical protein